MTPDAEQLLSKHGFQDIGETKQAPRKRCYLKSFGVIDVIIKLDPTANEEDVLLALFEAGASHGRYDYQYRVSQAMANLKTLCSIPVLDPSSLVK